jgi:hypothetical protein
MERRAFKRIPVHIEVRYYCRKEVKTGTVINLSEKGMFIATQDVCLPFESQIEILLPLNKEFHCVPVNLCRMIISPDSYDGIGVELANPNPGYLAFIDSLKS